MNECPWAKNVCVILVEPLYKGNVGAISRTMNNFGFSDLRVVGEIPKKEDYYVAVHSEEILNSAKVFDTFEEAISGFDRLIAISRRKGQKKPVDLLPENLGKLLKQHTENRVGIVFGRETYGLKDSEADQCHFRCYIPAQPEFPSLNLSQAVGVILYEIYRAFTDEGTDTISDSAAPIEEIDRSAAFIDRILDDIHYGSVGDREKSVRIVRDLMIRSNISSWEANEFRQIFNRVSILAGNRGLKWKKFEDQ